ncbi:MAG: S-layer y domain [Acidimicrobiia bacterium]|nr:S-layer y domain [Acidimicrobiia bacterium]
MRKSKLIAVLVVGTLLVPVAVFASHSFNDVPDDHTFHDAIAWMKDNGVTVGCNPPANTNYCPEDNVTRAQMAAFMRRLAENQVVDAATAVVAGTAHEATRSALVTVAGTSSGTATSIATLTDLPAGAYVVTGTWVATAHGPGAGGRVVCNLTAGASTGRAIALITNPDAGQESMASVVTGTLAAGDQVNLSCWTEGLAGSISVSSTHVVAHPVMAVESVEVTS